MTDGPDPSESEAPETEQQDRFIAPPDKPEDQAERIEEEEPDPALEEQEPETEDGDEEVRRREDKIDEEIEQSFPASDPPTY